MAVGRGPGLLDEAEEALQAARVALRRVADHLAHSTADASPASVECARTLLAIHLQRQVEREAPAAAFRL